MSPPSRVEPALQTTQVPNVVADHIDQDAFPLLHAYLRDLPNGMHSYPECQVIADYTNRLRVQYAEVWRDPRLPLPLRNLLRAPRPNGVFVSTVYATCQSLLMRDFHRVSEAQYLNGAEQVLTDVLSSPVYRALLYVMSPSLLVLNLAGRWSAFVRGTELVSLGGTKNSHKLKLTAPPGLYPSVWHQFYANAFTHCLRASRASYAKVTLERVSPTETLYETRWER